MSQPAPVLHLALPGLLWPAQAMRDLVFDLELPALSWLLGKGSRELSPAADSLHWLARVAGLDETQRLPAAALRVAATTTATDAAGPRWLCLDPIHLRVERTQLIVQDPAALQLTQDEAEALQRDLAPLLDELGRLQLDAPHHWHLLLHETSADDNLRTTPLADAIGLNGDQLMPQAANVRTWRRLLNEVQVTLHAHPVNLARSERGLPAVNSLWPWGEGALDAAQRPAWHTIQADGLLWQGLARHLGCAWMPLPQRFAPQPGQTLCIHTGLENAARQRDAVQWLAAVQALEQDWFAPLQAALQNGSLHTLVLHGSGEGRALRLTVTARDRFRFWRKPAPLTVLGVADTGRDSAP